MRGSGRGAREQGSAPVPEGSAAPGGRSASLRLWLDEDVVPPHTHIHTNAHTHNPRTLRWEGNAPHHSRGGEAEPSCRAAPVKGPPSPGPPGFDPGFGRVLGRRREGAAVRCPLLALGAPGMMPCRDGGPRDDVPRDDAPPG